MMRTLPVTASGIYDIAAADYHADPCPAPSLSHTIAKLMLRSPRHAWKAHPRLGGTTPRTGSSEMAIGSAVHALLLGKGAALSHLPYDNYRTKEAQVARDAAYAQGFIPLLTKEYELAETMAEIGRPALSAALGRPVGLCLCESVIITDAGGLWRRSMVDAMTPDLRVIVDWKTCANAEPDAFANTVRTYYATQAAFYSDVLDAIDPEGAGKRRFLFCAQERDMPEAITVHELDQAALEIAQAQMRRASERWIECLAADNWPAYDPGPHLVSPRQWEIDAEFERQYEEGRAEVGL